MPAEVVEAAAKAAYEVMPVELFGRDHPVTWEQLSESVLGRARKDDERAKARAALEAARPFIRAKALEDAAKQMREERHSWCLDDAGRYWIKRTLDDLAERAVAERGGL